jgi:uncharacterized membrane protein HdeD (DUF308 family)
MYRRPLMEGTLKYIVYIVAQIRFSAIDVVLTFYVAQATADKEYALAAATLVVGFLVSAVSRVWSATEVPANKQK